eukprot:g61176.t1
MAGGRSKDAISTMNTSGGKAGWTALFDAAENLHVEVAQLLPRRMQCDPHRPARVTTLFHVVEGIWKWRNGC